MNYRQIEMMLRNDGWVWFRTRGSHRHFRHPVKPGIVTVPYHGGSADLSRPLVRSILRQAGLRR
ncbi:MAG TPA: type II toxin-antitoxin system HicA family toxin [Candidatus Limnocylindrales bacterium]|nr:type II toxin-antitoxin system HicA family toxin [Candidatus Limnocylindrales bacterium]